MPTERFTLLIDAARPAVDFVGWVLPELEAWGPVDTRPPGFDPPPTWAEAFHHLPVIATSGGYVRPLALVTEPRDWTQAPGPIVVRAWGELPPPPSTEVPGADPGPPAPYVEMPAALEFRVTPIGKRIQIDATYIEELAAYYQQMREKIRAVWTESATAAASAPKHAGGRPLKYQDRADFSHDVQIAARSYHYAKGRLPSKAALAHALGIGQATLAATLTRFQMTDAELQRMMEDQITVEDGSDS